jgi:hypothetical protein
MAWLLRFGVLYLGVPIFDERGGLIYADTACCSGLVTPAPAVAGGRGNGTSTIPWFRS